MNESMFLNKLVE